MESISVCVCVCVRERDKEGDEERVSVSNGRRFIMKNKKIRDLVYLRINKTPLLIRTALIKAVAKH